MEIYIVEDDRTVINILEDIIETNGLGTVCGSWLDAMGNEGYRYIWLLGAVGGLMMLLMGIAISKKYKAY